MKKKKLSPVEEERKILTTQAQMAGFGMVFILFLYHFNSFGLSFSTVCAVVSTNSFMYTLSAVLGRPDNLLEDENFVKNLQCTPEKFRNISLFCGVLEISLFVVAISIGFCIENEFIFALTFSGFLLINLIINIGFSRFFNKVYPNT